MTRSPTIKERCRGRLLEMPRQGDAPRDERIAILRRNLQVMREVIGRIPFPYPQSEAEVPQWIDRSDRSIVMIETVIRGLANLPPDALVPSPFVSGV